MFVSATCQGERCFCGEPAAHKIEEAIAADDPLHDRHPLTCYICHGHFALIMGPHGVGAVRRVQDVFVQFESQRRERMEKALLDIRAWAGAYPLGSFPTPDLKKANEALKAAGLTLDSISADAMRHVLQGVTNLVNDGLGVPEVPL